MTSDSGPLYGGPLAGATPERQAERAKTRAQIQEMLARLDRPRPKRAPRSDEEERRYRERANVRRRLSHLGKRVDAVAAELEQIHGDGSGWHHWAPMPLFEREWQGARYAPGIGPSFQRAKRDAAAGCDLSAQFVQDYEALVLLCDHLRHERPPQRSADWRPTLPPQAGNWRARTPSP